MPIFSSGYPTNSSPADDDVVLTSDTDAGNAIKGVTFANLFTYIKTKLIATVGWITLGMMSNDSIDTDQVIDGSITDAKLDYPRWWQEIGRTTLGVAGDTITVSSLPARKYLKILFFIHGTNKSLNCTFNGDTAANYSRNVGTNGGAYASAVSQNNHAMTSSVTDVCTGYLDVFNDANQEKQGEYHVIERSTAGAASAPNKRDATCKWANTTDQISSITFTNGGAGDYAIGSEVVVLGHD